MYLIIQKGYALFGSGHTKEEALEDMREWINKDSELQHWTASDFETCYNSANDAQMVLVEATKELAEHYDVDLGGKQMFMYDYNEQDMYSMASIIEANEDLTSEELQALNNCQVGDDLMIGMFVLTRTK
jgi:hypothetical protein